MEALNFLKGLDIYLLDQLLKDRISKKHKILDAGCGSGRNLIPLHQLGLNVEGFDSDARRIEELQLAYPALKPNLRITTIENFKSKVLYDFIICNAVLHFADTHLKFQEMFSALINLLAQNGLLFIRMTSNFAVKKDFSQDKDGIAFLPDGTRRYLLTRNQLTELLHQYKINLIEPIKTVNVDDKRCMTTLVFIKK